MYVPKGKKDFPVVLFVHGGSWKGGNKNLYAALGESLAKDGIGCVICNYRLSPQVQHPAHVEDVAKAFAWTCDNIEKYGGKKEQLFLCGHSAGGHLSSLLVTDPQYLKAEKHSPSEVKGVASFSGVYQIVNTERVFEVPFGKDEKVCKLASPLTHAAGKHPPFLIAYADNDFPRLDRRPEHERGIEEGRKSCRTGEVQGPQPHHDHRAVREQHRPAEQGLPRLHAEELQVTAARRSQRRHSNATDPARR